MLILKDSVSAYPAGGTKKISNTKLQQRADKKYPPFPDFDVSQY